MSTNKEKKQIKLPFMPQKFDAGEWAYDNRRGLLWAFVIGVIFLFSALYVTITLENKLDYNTIIIDFEDNFKEPEKQPLPEKQKQVKELDFSQIDNQISNENAQGLNDQLTDDRNTPAKAIYDEVREMEEKARQNKEIYQRGLAEDAAISASKGKATEQTEVQDVKVDGMVTVSFSFMNPVRNSVNLTVPAYMCEGGGMVVVDAQLDNNGRVVAATLNKSTTTSDNCMIQTAISAAKSSRFDINIEASARQQGTITYIFIPQ